MLNTKPIKDFHMTSFHRRSEMSISNQPTNGIYNFTQHLLHISLPGYHSAQSNMRERERLSRLYHMLIPLFLTNVYTNSYKDK